MANDALDALVSIVPVVVLGGVVTKFAERMDNRTYRKTMRKSRGYKKPKRFKGNGLGDFSNIGF